MSMNPLMSGYELRIVKGLLASSADLIKNDKMVNATVRQALGQEVEETLEELLGEQKIEQAVELKGADALFGDIVITPKKDE